MAERGVCILVLEDNEAERDILEMQFQDILEQDEVLVTADNGMNAIDKLKTLDPPLGFILDLNMPGQIKGIDVLRYIRQDSRLKDCPVFIFSSSDNPRDKARCMDLGADQFIRKPQDMFESEAIINRLVKVCRSWNMSAGGDSGDGGGKDTLGRLLDKLGG